MFKVVMQGTLFQRWAYLLYCSVLSLGPIFHIKNQWNILVIGNYYVNYQNYPNLMLLSSSVTKRTLLHLFLFQIPPGENWFQYVHRAYATAINFPWIITLILFKILELSLWHKLQFSNHYFFAILFDLSEFIDWNI